MRDAPRNRTLVRCLRLWRELDGRRVLPSLEELAREHGVSTRTIRRDLAALEEAYYAVPPPCPFSLRSRKILVDVKATHGG